MLIKKFIIGGIMLAAGWAVLNAQELFGSAAPLSSLQASLPFSQRTFVLLIGVGLIALRWYFVHGKSSANDEP